MALVLSDEVTREAQRIIAAKNAFEVLEILPDGFTPALVLEHYEAKVQLFKRHFRNKTAAVAKSRVDEAKMRVLDDRLRAKEVESFTAVVIDEAQVREELRQLEERTKLLELRAAAAVQRKAKREAAAAAAAAATPEATEDHKTETAEAEAVAGAKRSRDGAAEAEAWEEDTERPRASATPEAE
eukprot:gene8168-5697_t